MKPSSVLIHSNGLSERQVKLGRLVTNIWTPFDSFHDSPSLIVSDLQEIDEITDHNSTLSLNRNRNDSLTLKLSNLFGIGLKDKSDMSLVIKAKSASTISLLDYTETFNRVFKRPNANDPDKTRAWVQNRIENGENVYMVVGIRTVTDAKVTQMQQSNVKGSLDGNIPVTQVVSHGVSNALSGWSPLDVSIAVAIGRDHGDSAEYEIQGTRVIAVQYCKVKLSVRKLLADGLKDDKVKLADRTWQWYIGNTRGDPENERRSSFEVEVLLGRVVDAASVLEGDDYEDEGEEEHGDGIDHVSVGSLEIVF